MHAHVRAVDGTRKKPLVVSRLLARAEPLLARVRLLLAPFVPDDVRLLPISFAPMDRGRQKTRNEARVPELRMARPCRRRLMLCREGSDGVVPFPQPPFAGAKDRN